jgi:hypothetical protein
VYHVFRVVDAVVSGLSEWGRNGESLTMCSNSGVGDFRVGDDVMGPLGWTVDARLRTFIVGCSTKAWPSGMGLHLIRAKNLLYQALVRLL